MANDQEAKNTSTVQAEQQVEETSEVEESEMYAEASTNGSDESEVIESVTVDNSEAEIAESAHEESDMGENQDDEAVVSGEDPEPEEEEAEVNAEGGEDEDDEDDEDDDEDEEDPEDPADVMRDSCSKSSSCKPLMKTFEACEERVASKSHTEETCLEEYLDFIQCRDKCVSRDLFSKLK